ncbi:hypothetical protein [Xylanimonas oleitrophica]|uniref:hypothetical protein n=1 Tax=Xylanimonas oleitrophica TaxID=2607479 RepID=UPI0015D05A32|nr:hypothetical protein [Xylanimonas oleitrophica]
MTSTPAPRPLVRARARGTVRDWTLAAAAAAALLALLVGTAVALSGLVDAVVRLAAG